MKTHDVNVRPVIRVNSTAGDDPAHWCKRFNLSLLSSQTSGSFSHTRSSHSLVNLRVSWLTQLLSSDGYEYTLQLVKPGATGLDADADGRSDFDEGSLWGMLFANVGLDFSRGNASNWTAPGLVRSKIGTVRKSYQFSGNAKDYVAEFNLPMKEGSSTKLWMDYEEYRHMLKFKEECEMYYWYGQRTHDDTGRTQMVDENGQPVVSGPGLFEQIINKDTYSTLTQKKIEDTIGDLFYGMTDATDKQVTLFTGIGGAREFDKALRNYYAGGSGTATSITQWTAWLLDYYGI